MRLLKLVPAARPWLLHVFFICLSYSIAAQPPCRGAANTDIFTAAGDRAAATCNMNFSANTAKYYQLSNYIPGQTTPLTTLKIVMHVFHPVNLAVDDPYSFWPGGMANNDFTALNNMLNPQTNGFEGQGEEFSQPMKWYQGNPAVLTNPPNGFSPTYVHDSKLRFEVVGIYYYPNNQLYYGTANGQPANNSNPRITNGHDCLNYINNNPSYAGRLLEGVPVIMNTDCQWMDNFSAAGAGSLPFVSVCHWSAYQPFFPQQLRHEINHCLGLQHMYYGNGPDSPTDIPSYPGNPANSPETPMPAGGQYDRALNCNDPDYLDDAFPPSNPYCANLVNHPPSSQCGSCYECNETGGIPNMYTNNQMSGGGSGDWLSPKQMAKRNRAMHFLPVRYYAKEVLSDHANPHEIVSGTTESWEFDVQLYRDIIVRTGSTLFIKCIVKMPTDGRIIVEKGAKLVIDGGWVTGWCQKTPANSHYNMPLWTGIEVDGDPTQSQAINPGSGYCPYQGIVEVKNNGRIDKAYKAINTSRTNLSTGAWINNTSGGIVIATNARFFNNVYDIIFYKYHQSNISSRVENCNFQTNTKIGVDANNNDIAPREHIKLYDNSYINIKGCSFSYIANNTYPIGSRGIGIYSTDSYYTVDQYNSTKSSFTNLNEGVYVDNANPLLTPMVRNCVFNGNLTAAKAENCNYFIFTDNVVTVPSGETGCYMYKSRYYKIRNNTFTETNASKAGFAVIAFESKSGYQEVYRNTFSGFLAGILCQDDNGSTLGLKMNCNTFNSGSSNSYDIAMTTTAPGKVSTVMSQQSSNTAASALGLVRNRYGALPTPNGPNTFVENKWFNPGGQLIIHSSTNNGVDNPKVPQVQASSQVFVGYYGFTINYTNDCPANTTSAANISAAPRSEKLALMNSYITDLRNNDPDNLFEIQSTVGGKLQLFIADTLPDAKDSIKAILTGNQGNFDDADIQLAFAHLKSGNFDGADLCISNLPDARGDWQGMLQHVSAMKKHPGDIAGYMSDAANQVAISSIANTDGMDGQACAQAILSYVGVPHAFPIAPPPNGNDRIVGLTGITDNTTRLYPNPVQNNLTIENLPANKGSLVIELVDVLGKLVLTKPVTNPENQAVSLSGLTEGVYLLKVIDSKKNVVYQNKVMKQN